MFGSFSKNVIIFHYLAFEKKRLHLTCHKREFKDCENAKALVGYRCERLTHAWLGVSEVYLSLPAGSVGITYCVNCYTLLEDAGRICVLYYTRIMQEFRTNVYDLINIE